MSTYRVLPGSVDPIRAAQQRKEPPVHKYHMSRSYVPTDKVPVVSVDHAPSMYYYGTCVLSRAATPEEEEEYGLTPYTEQSADSEAESHALYNAEMRHTL